MAIQLFRQETQIRNSDLYDDTISPTLANFETAPVNVEEDLNNLRSAVSNLIDNQAGDWYTDLITPSTLDVGTQRGVNDLNTDLHAIERKRVIIARKLLVDVVVGGADNFKILTAGQLPSVTTAAVGSVTTEGVVVAFHSGTFGTHSLAEVSGAHALAPKNLLEITDAAGDPIMSTGRRIWGLLQTETATDGHTMTTSTPTRAQISFVRPDSAHADLEVCPAVDIQGQTIRYCYAERIAFDDMTEQDFFASGAAIDIGAGSATVTRQAAYDNQGVTPVDLTTDATLDLEGAGLAWTIRDDLQANLFQVIEGSAGGTSEVRVHPDVDEFDCDAALNDFLQGVTVDSGGTAITLGVTAGQIASGGALTVASGGASDLRLFGIAELFLDDGNQTGSTWAQTSGIKLSDTTAEWDAYETEFGEVSLLNAIVQAKNTSGRRRVFSVVTVDALADVNVSGPANDNNLDADLGDLSVGTFTSDYDFFLNGQYQRPGANAAANFDLYPGTSLASGQLKFEKKLKTGDTICVIDYAE
jgi:hypothetical protein